MSNLYVDVWTTTAPNEKTFVVESSQSITVDQAGALWVKVPDWYDMVGVLFAPGTWSQVVLRREP